MRNATQHLHAAGPVSISCKIAPLVARHPCADCAIARGYADHRVFNPACIHCGARYVQSLHKLALRPAQIKDRVDHVLTVWGELGHPAKEILKLSKGDLPTEPLPQAAAPKANSKSTKARA